MFTRRQYDVSHLGNTLLQCAGGIASRKKVVGSPILDQPVRVPDPPKSMSVSEYIKSRHSPPATKHTMPADTLKESIGSLAASIHQQALDGKVPISQLNQSEIPVDIAKRAGLGVGTSGSLSPSSRYSAMAMCDVADALLSEANKVPPTIVDETEAREARARNVLCAMDLVLSELVRQVMVDCTERGLLLQYVREQIFESCANLSYVRMDFSEQDAAIQAELDEKKQELSQTKEELVEVKRHVKTLNFENSRLGRVNMRMAMQKAREAVLARASALGSDEEVNRKMVIECVTKATQELQRAECTITLAKRPVATRGPSGDADEEDMTREGALYVTYASAEVQTSPVFIGDEPLTQEVRDESKSMPRRIYYAKDVATDVDDLITPEEVEEPEVVEELVEVPATPLPLEKVPSFRVLTMAIGTQTDAVQTKDECVQCFPAAKPVRSQGVQADRQKREYMPPGMMAMSDVTETPYATRSSLTSVEPEHRSGDAPVIALDISATSLNWSRGKVRPLSWLYSTILNIFSGGIHDGGVPHAGACYFRTKFGLSRVADSYIADFFMTLQAFKDSSRRAAVFIQFCRIPKSLGAIPQEDAYTPNGLAMYRRVLSAVRNSAWRSMATSLVEGETKASVAAIFSILDGVLGSCYTLPLLRGVKVGLVRAAWRCESVPAGTSVSLYIPNCVSSPPAHIHALIDSSIADTTADMESKTMCLDALLDVFASNTDSALIPLSSYSAQLDSSVQRLINVLHD
jgi:hypothetical protein